MAGKVSFQTAPDGYKNTYGKGSKNVHSFKTFSLDCASVPAGRLRKGGASGYSHAGQHTNKYRAGNRDRLADKDARANHPCHPNGQALRPQRHTDTDSHASLAANVLI